MATTSNNEKLISLGRFMLDNVAFFVDDITYNNWTRVGELLVHAGTPFALQLREFTPEDRDVVVEAAKIMAGILPLPESKVIVGRERIKRPARMSKALRKDQM